MSRRDEIVAAAEAILERDGPEGLTMRNVADALGIRAPSLYKHVAGRDEILAALQARALSGMGDALAAAAGGPDGAPEGVEGMMGAYRDWALAHPALYELATRHPLARDALPEGLEAAAGAPVRALAPDPATARALWATAHGLVDLELAGRFPPGADIPAAWAAAARAFAGALR